MIERLNHVAIAVPELGSAAAKYRDALGAKVSEPMDLPEHGVTVVFIELQNAKIELIAPLGENSPIAGFLAKNPSGGIHHICFEVPNVAAASEAMSSRNVRLLGSEPSIGAHGLPVMFVHPKEFNGTLIEIEES